MKRLPCQRCKGGALSSPTTRFPKGEPLLCGVFHGPRLVYRCGRCKRTQTLSPQEYRALPDLTVADLKALNLDDLAEEQARAEEKAKGATT